MSRYDDYYKDIDEDEYKDFEIPLYYFSIDEKKFIDLIEDEIDKRVESKDYKEYLRLKSKFENK